MNIDMNIDRLRVILNLNELDTDRAFRVLAWLAENGVPWSASQGYNMRGEYGRIYVQIGHRDDNIVGSDDFFTTAVLYAARALVRWFDPA